ncbi:MAG: transcriptional regulator [Nocardioides sp.]|nr:transcriptional regulator [Nocardioides sp.]|tara:strand:+ start:148 stop:426 length:279 start_codon:yes stop_codon:yes gene_type:complete
MTGDSAQRELINRLSRIEGQVRGISRMVEEDTYCIDILTQVSAASRALQRVALLLLEDHIEYCLLDAARAGGAEREDKLKEASAAIGRLVRS